MKTITRSEPAINPVVTDCLVYWAPDLFVAGIRVGFIAPIVPARGGNESAESAYRRWHLVGRGSRTSFARATGSLAKHNVFCHDGRQAAAQQAIRRISMLAQTAAFFGGLPVADMAHTRSRLGKRNGVTHHVYTKARCSADLIWTFGSLAPPLCTPVHPLVSLETESLASLIIMLIFVGDA
jgi:hypothetical protein